MSTYIVNAIKNTTYQNCQNITSVDLQNIPWVDNSMHDAFRNCRSLQNVTNINDNITNMANAFRFCYNLVNTPEIPNLVTDITNTFGQCANLVNAPAIPNSVINMAYTFDYCDNLVNAPVIPTHVTNIRGTFRNCSSLVNAPIIPNSIADMGYTFAQCSKLVNAPTIPNSVTNMSGTFTSCSNLVDAPVIPNSVTDIYRTFSSCSKLINVPEIPNSVTNMALTFEYCRRLVNAPVISNSVTDMYETFSYCSNLTGNINVLSNQVTNATNCFINTSLSKNVYIPFTYTNGVNTATYNAFTAAGYDNAGTQHGVYLKDINPAPAPRKVLNVEDYTYTSDAEDNVILETYTGASTSVKIPVIEDEPSETAYYAWKNGSTIVYTLQSTPDFHIDVYSDTNQTYYGYIKDIDSSTEVTIRHEGVDTMFERYSAGDVVVPDVDLSYGSND